MITLTVILGLVVAIAAYGIIRLIFEVGTFFEHKNSISRLAARHADQKYYLEKATEKASGTQL